MRQQTEAELKKLARQLLKSASDYDTALGDFSVKASALYSAEDGDKDGYKNDWSEIFYNVGGEPAIAKRIKSGELHDSNADIGRP